jgi:hypothetical protein
MRTFRWQMRKVLELRKASFLSPPPSPPPPTPPPGAIVQTKPWWFYGVPVYLREWSLVPHSPRYSRED